MTNVALVGAGNWGGNWLRTLATLPNVNLRWVCDLNRSLLEKIQAQYPSVRCTADYEDLLRDSSLEGIVLATIAPTHFRLAKSAIDAGKHVMIEKPMTLTTADAVELNRLADQRGVLIMVGHLLEYHPAVLKLRELIDAGELGEVRRIECRRLNYGRIRTDENCWWSLAPHDISIALRLMGEWPSSIFCFGQNIVQPHIADVVSGSIYFPGDRVAKVDVSWHDPGKVRTVIVFGTKKWAVFDDMSTDKKLMLHDKGFDSDGQGRVSMRSGSAVAVPLDPVEPLVAEATHFAESIRRNTRPRSDGVSGMAVVSVLEYGQQSLESGRTVAIPRPQLNGDSPQRKAA